MAALSDATVIIEAGDTSGTLQQAAECVRLGRRLFITRSTMEDPSLHWPRKFTPYPNVATMSSVEESWPAYRNAPEGSLLLHLQNVVGTTMERAGLGSVLLHQGGHLNSHVSA